MARWSGWWIGVKLWQCGLCPTWPLWYVVFFSVPKNPWKVLLPWRPGSNQITLSPGRATSHSASQPVRRMKAENKIKTLSWVCLLPWSNWASISPTASCEAVTLGVCLLALSWGEPGPICWHRQPSVCVSRKSVSTGISNHCLDSASCFTFCLGKKTSFIKLCIRLCVCTYTVFVVYNDTLSSAVVCSY